jgi:hypothetical protein
MDNVGINKIRKLRNSSVGLITSSLRPEIEKCWLKGYTAE